jgi:hypothetical protein
LAEARVQGVSEAREQLAGVAVARLQRQPGDGPTTITGIRGGERALAEPSRRNEQDQRTSAVLVENLKQPLTSEFMRRRLGHAGRARFH